MSTHGCISSPCWICHPELAPKALSSTLDVFTGKPIEITRPEDNVFRKALGPEKCEALDRNRERIEERRKELSEMTDVHLADSLEYTLVNDSFTSKHHGRLESYDDALVLVYLPELLRRLRKAEQKANTYEELIKRRQHHREIAKGSDG